MKIIIRISQISLKNYIIIKFKNLGKNYLHLKKILNKN